MPRPDGGLWLTTSQVAQRIIDDLNIRMDGSTVTFPLPPADEAIMRLHIAQAYRATGYVTEFKLIRLLEKFKDKVADGTINTMPQVVAVFGDIYDINILDTLDEEGDPL